MSPAPSRGGGTSRTAVCVVRFTKHGGKLIASVAICEDIWTGRPPTRFTTADVDEALTMLRAVAEELAREQADA